MTLEELKLRIEAVFPGEQVRTSHYNPMLVIDFQKPFQFPGFQPITRLWLRPWLGPYSIRAYHECPETGRLVRVVGPIGPEIERELRSVTAHQLIAARRRLAREEASA